MKRIHPFESSSTKFALLFSGLLIIALAPLIVEIYSLMQGDRLNPLYTAAALSVTAIIAIGFFVLSFYVTKRINRIADTADRIITTRDLTQRIPIDSRWDDLSKLSSILNLMLEEIEQLVDSVRQVSDNVAHDLRTPLTRMRNHIESMRAESETPEKSEQFGQLIDECDSMLATFNALLRIANIEAGKRHSAFTALDLTSVVKDVIELYEPVATDKNIQLSCDAKPATIIGDKDLLFQAIANLLDNAIKYTPYEGSIHIMIQPRSSGGTQLTIADTGYGIENAQKTLVFRRFYRVDKCRNQPGSGLGLSLVAAVIKLHQGNISLTDNTPQGLVVTVTL